MNAFSAAADAIFADAHMAADAVYTPDGGAPVTVRVILARPDERADWRDTTIVSATAMVSVRVSEVAAPAVGDTFAIGGSTYTVQGVPERDPRNLVWRIEARPS